METTKKLSRAKILKHNMLLNTGILRQNAHKLTDVGCEVSIQSSERILYNSLYIIICIHSLNKFLKGLHGSIKNLYFHQNLFVEQKGAKDNMCISKNLNIMDIYLIAAS